MSLTEHRLIPSDFTPIPSHAPDAQPRVVAVAGLSAEPQAVGILVGDSGDIPGVLGLDRESLARAGFDGTPGQSLLLPSPSGHVHIAVGIGSAPALTEATLRDAAATFARAAHRYPAVAIVPGDSISLDDAIIGQAIAEGIILARYRYTQLAPSSKHARLESLEIVAAPERLDGIAAGARTGTITAAATNLARDLSNAPPGHLSATVLGDVALGLADQHGLEVEVFDRRQVIELGLGGLLGVNAGSAEEPRLIKITYRPDAAEGAPHLAMIGKGIMYDSGGISLKPSDSMHLLMKMDMAGAAAILGAMTALKPLGCTSVVTGFLSCTDNMPSGTAMGLGDVLTIRGGTTVEIKNTDAEGRLVMADALVLAAEEHPDAIVDIATLTGSALQTLGTRVAAVFGNNQAMIDQTIAASVSSDESVWQLPLETRYRAQLNSAIADMSNMGGPFNVAITAALFLNEFVDGIPWAHLDIAGTMQSDTDDSWRSAGATGFGTRLLIDLALDFTPVN